ncbi:MAG TPA: helix-turn-helix domain-containing protein [Candidatus Saccharimonadales bacterium]|nr:helix-turn-helix domain-containing protein [Candidatus Saccharimonadales bacterium]
MKKGIPFNEAALISGMKEALAHAKGKLTLRTTTPPALIRRISPDEVAHIRRKLNASISVFAAYLNVTPVTVRSWEKNRRHPSGAALRLLQIAKRQPQILLASA